MGGQTINIEPLPLLLKVLFSEGRNTPYLWLAPKAVMNGVVRELRVKNQLRSVFQIGNRLPVAL